MIAIFFIILKLLPFVIFHDFKMLHTGLELEWVHRYCIITLVPSYDISKEEFSSGDFNIDVILKNLIKPEVEDLNTMYLNTPVSLSRITTIEYH